MMRRLLIGPGDVARLAGASAADPSTGAVTWPGGAAIGRLALIWTTCGASVRATNGGAGWSSYDFDTVIGAGGRLFSKVLEAADITSPPTITFPNSQGHMLIGIFAGVSSLSVRIAGVCTVADTVRILSGFSKTAGAKLQVYFFDDRNTALATGRSTARVATSRLGSFGYAQLDVEYPATYTSGGSLTWTVADNTFASAYAQALELS